MKTLHRSILDLLGLTIIVGALCAPVCASAGGLVAAWGGGPQGETCIPQGLTDVKAVYAWGANSLALKADGTVVVWGNNSRGQTNVPAGLSNVKKLAACGGHILAL